MNLNNKVIKVIDTQHGAKVIQFFKDNGVDTKGYQGYCTEKDRNNFIYYGIINGIFDNYANSEFGNNVEIIELPEELQFPQIMEVSDWEDFKRSFIRVVFIKKNDEYLTWAGAETLEEAEKTNMVSSYVYARPIQPKKEKVVELTLQDISEGKGVGVPSHLIRIKE